MGEWPSRDFVELGLPLMEFLSAIPFWIVPDAPLFGETVLVAVMFGLAAAFTLYAARRLTSSWWIALLVVALQVVLFPRTYSYPKMLAYAVGLLAMWRYVERPSPSRLTQLAFVIVVAFLLRHDHGLYLGVGGLITVVMVAMAANRRDAVRKGAIFAGINLAFLAPYVVYIAVHEGLWRYLLRELDLQSVESSRGRTIPAFTFEGGFLTSNAEPWLFFFFHCLPFVAAAVAWARWRQKPDARELAMVVPLIVVAVLANVGLIRDTLSARLPDAVVPVSLLLGWLLAHAVRVRPAPGRGLAWVAAATLVVMTMASATAVGATGEQLEKAEMLGGLGQVLDHVQSRSAQLRERFPSAQVPSRIVSTLLPFFAYTDRCLGPRDHIFIPGYAPEVAVWARRPFAGGQVWFQTELLTSDEDHRFVMARLNAQRVPVAIVLSPTTESIAAGFEALGQYLRDHFPDRTALSTEDEETVTIAFDPRLAVGRDHATGWYCYR